MVYAIVAVVIIAVLIVAARNRKRSKAINENGIEVDAVVSRIKEVETVNADGDRYVNYEYFVKFRNEMGETVEARLGNPSPNITEGTRLRVKYLPQKPKHALEVKP